MGITGFERFMEVLEIEPDIEDRKRCSSIYKMLKVQLNIVHVGFKYNQDQ